MLTKGRGDCTVNLEYWVNTQIDKLEDFRKWWNANNDKDSINWPLVLRPGEWDEQFDFYCDERNK